MLSTMHPVFPLTGALLSRVFSFNTLLKKRLTIVLLTLGLVLLVVFVDEAAIIQRGTSTTGITTNTTITINKPTGVVTGDVLIVNIAQVGNNSTDPTLSGWTLIAGASLTGQQYAAVLYKVAGSSEPANYTFTLGTNVNSAVGSIVAFSGVDVSGGYPFDVTPPTISVQPNQAAVVATAITTATANAAVIMFGMAAGSAPTWSGWTTSSPGALIELYDNQSSNASVGAAWAIQTSAGSTGFGAATLSPSEKNGGILIALKNYVPPTNYYIRTGGTFSANLQNAASWTDNPTGSGGTSPVNFTTAKQVFNIGYNSISSSSVSANWTVSGTNSKVIIGDGTNPSNFSVGSNYVLTTPIDILANGILTLSTTGVLTNIVFGTLSTGSTVNYAEAGIQTCAAVTYDNLILSGSGAKTTTGATVTSILSIEGAASIGGTVPSWSGTAYTLQYKTTDAHTVGTEWTTPFVGSGGVIIANTAGSVILNNAKVFNASIPLTINSGATLNTNNLQLTLGGDFNNSGTFTAGSSPVVITNTMANQSIDGFSTTGLVSMTKASGTAIFQGNVNGAGLTINGAGGGILNLGTNLSHTFTGIVTLTAGTLNGGSSTLHENMVSANAWNGTGTLFIAGSGTVDFGASGNQTLSASSTTFNNLTISNTSGVTLNSSITINGTLNLTSGIITTGANTVTITNTATTAVTGGSVTNFVNGPLIWSLVAATNYTFPIGKGSTYLPFALTSLTGTNPQLRIEAFTASTGGTPSSPLTFLSTTEYWLASLVSGTFTGASVSITRQTALNQIESVGRNTTTINGAYSNLNGTASGTSINTSDNTGSSLGYFVMASKKSIATGTISPTTYCPGSSVSVPYTITGTYNAGNIFTAQLSDAAGSFTSPVTIGTLTSQIAGTISASIPGGQPIGSGYRIRVISNNPAITGSDNGVNLSVDVPNLTAAFPGSRCDAGTITLSATASVGTINWYAALSGGSSLGTGTTFTTPFISSSTTYYVDATYGSCTTTPRIAVLATIIPGATITAGGAGTFCSGTNVNLTSSGTNISNQYWSGPGGFYSLIANPVLTPATAAMSGAYTVTGSSLSGVNLITNGDFESGNMGFASSYIVSGSLLLEGTYAVVANPNSVHSGFTNCTNHTPSGTLQMVINGAITSGVNVWSQTANVVPGTDYQFTYWVQSVVASNPSQLQLYINGIVAGPIYTAITATCQWAQFTYNWNSGVSTTAFLSLINQNTIAGGNDFTLDDIIFQQVCAASSSVVVTVNADVTAGVIGTAQSICSGTTPATLTSITAGTGSGTITYEWQTNASGSYVTIGGATAATYVPPALTDTTSYQRRTVSLSGGTTCYSPYTTPITITIYGHFAIAGGPNSACQSATPSAITLSGASLGGGATTGAWSIISGGGALSSTAQTATPATVTYTPAANYSGSVTLRLTTNIIGTCAAIADRTITITAAPTAIAGTAVSTCSNSGAVNITAGSSASNNASITWTSGGTGSFTNANSLTTATYTPSVADILAGSVTLTLTAVGNSPCGNAVSTKTLLITTLPVATFSYAATPYCSNAANPSPTFTGGGVAGTFSSTAGLVFVSIATGQVNISASTAGTYTVTNTIAAAGGCALVAATSSMTVSSLIGNNSLDFTNGLHGTICGTPPENSNAVLTAPAGTIFINVGFASYGTPTGTCPTFTLGGCHALTSQSVTEGYLLGNNTASIPATNAVYGDPCVGTFKRVYVLATYTEPICSGNTPGAISGTLPTGGNGSYTYLWESSTTGPSSGFASASGTNNLQNYSPGALTQTTWYRRTVSSGGCSSTSTVILIKVSPAIAGNTIGSVQTICSGSAPVALTGSLPTGGDGTYVYLWGSSTTNATTGFASASGTNNGQNYTPGTLSQTTWYRRTVTSGGCTNTTTAIQITVTPLPVATFSYSATPYCSNAANPSPTYSGGGVAGTFSSTAGLVFVSTATGQVNLATSTAGTYTVTNTIAAAGGCGIVTATSSITITTLPVATFSYAGTSSPTYSGGGVAGTFSSTAGLNFVSTATGQVNLATSTPGTYTVTNTIAAAGGCGIVTATNSITITPLLTVGFVWNGSVSTDWNDLNNWSTGIVPGLTSDAIIPDASTTPNDPILPSSPAASVKTISLQNNAILNGGTATTLTIAGSTSAWTNLGTLNAGTSNISFTNANATMSGQADFYNVTIATGAGLTPASGNIMRIAGALTLQGTGILNAAVNANTIEYNGTNQAVINPNGSSPGYYYLILSGSGTKTLPITALAIFGDFSLSGTASATTGASMTVGGNLTIGSGNHLSVAPLTGLTVTGTIVNNAGTAGFVLQSDATGTASLLHNTNNVPATVQRYISGPVEAWHFLASPVSAQSISGSWLPSGTYGNGTGYDLYIWNEPTSCWIYKLDTTSTVNWKTLHPGTNFTPGRGYLYSVQATNPTKDFQGNLNNGSISYPITFSSAIAGLKGFNFVGNPYPSAIDWQASAGWTRSDLTTSAGGYDMWVWNPAADNYGVFNSTLGTGTNSVTRYLAPMQGFFVQASSSGNLGMNNSIRIHNIGGSWFKSTETNPGTLSIVVQSESDKNFDEVRLLFGYTSNQSGAVKLFSHVNTAPSLYMPSGNEYFSVRYLTDTIENPIVPVMFKPGKNGNYTLNCNFNTDEFEIVMLEDRQRHYIQNLKAKNTYSFQSSTSDDVSRFILHFGPDKNAHYDELPARIYSDGDQLVIDLSLVGTETEVMVYDAIGRLLVNKTLQGTSSQKLRINIQPQILLVHLKNQQGIITRKIFFNNKYK